MNEPRVSVALTFDFDAISPWLQVTTASPSFISRGEFGPVAVDRISDLLDEYNVSATFFTPGHTAAAYPDSVRLLVSRGHEIGHHGWVHEGLSALTEDEERAIIERGFEALSDAADVRPRGFRAPLFDLSKHTTALLADYGFSYDSSMMGHDFSPYWCRSGDVGSSTESYSFGRIVDLVEVPVAWHLNDVTFFEFVPGAPNLSGGVLPWDVLDIWKAEFSYLYEHIGEGSMTLTLHPQSIGRGHRLPILRRFIEFVGSHPEAGFARAEEIADRFRRGAE